MARDPNRIDELLAELRIYWVDNPDLRLCQIIGNFLDDWHRRPRPSRSNGEPEQHMSARGYITEDEELIKYLRERNE